MNNQGPDSTNYGENTNKRYTILSFSINHNWMQHEINYTSRRFLGPTLLLDKNPPSSNRRLLPLSDGGVYRWCSGLLVWKGGVILDNNNNNKTKTIILTSIQMKEHYSKKVYKALTLLTQLALCKCRVKSLFDPCGYKGSDEWGSCSNLHCKKKKQSL